jgi:orotate phosphoribosyltransferase
VTLDVSPAAIAGDRARMLALLTEKSYAKKKIVLSSGRESDFYIDCKKTILSAEGHYLTGKLMFAGVRESFSAAVGIGGLTMGADPIASAISLVSFLGGTPLHAFLVRKEPKGHGTGQWIEGLTSLPKDAPVVIVEDVVTTGASTLKAIERARAEGLKPIGAFTIVDRQEGGRETIEASGVPVKSLFTRSDFP